MHDSDGQHERLRVAGLPANEEQKRLLEQATLLLRYRMLLEKRLQIHRAAITETAAPRRAADAKIPPEQGL